VSDPVRPVAPADPPLIETRTPLSGRPVLLTGAASAAILGADGSFSLPWDTRGAPLEWGGVYAQGVRLTGPWSVAVGPEGAATVLGPSTLRSLRHWRWAVESEHMVAGLTVTDELLPLEGVSGIGRRLTLRSGAAEGVRLRVESTFRPSLGLVLIEGVQPYEYDLRTHGPTLFARAHGAALAVDSDPLPSTVSVDDRPWIGGARTGPVRKVGMVHDVSVPVGGSATVTWVLWGGVLATVDGNPDTGRAALHARGSWRENAARPWTEWSAGVPRLELPDDPGLAAGFRLATGALRALYAAPEPTMTGLVAGYPWYSALWFRDVAWMLPAVLWMGDVDRATAAVDTAFRYQAPADLALLGATEGELPMQLSPGPIFLYGTSDTSLYYPGIVRRLVDHTGDVERARPFRTGIGRILAWGLKKVDPATELIANGGEVEAMEGASHEIGSVHYGIDAFDTTIWDSTDRRDHAIDVQVLWQSALDAIADIGEGFGDPRVPELRTRASSVRAAIVGRYGWPEERYLYDSLRRDGSAVRKLRPNALRAVEAGLFDLPTSRAILDRAGEDDLTTAWGLRTLSNRDSSYDPLAYHDGQVWTIATAWAAAAAFRAERAAVGVDYLDAIAERIRSEGGYANECYRGDEATAFDSCFLLGFSVAPFLTTVFEGLWGLSPRLARRTIRCQPQFPAHWTSASLTGIRLGPGTLDLTWKSGTLSARWTGPWPVVLVGEHASVHLDPGTTATLAVPGTTAG
jgi:amylo-alpha-1,6-glucosidase